MRIIHLLIGIMLVQATFAQKFTRRKRYISADISYITSYYAGGDISVGQNRTVNSGVGINVQRKYFPRLSLGMHYNFQRLRAKDYLEVQHEEYPCTGLQLFQVGTNVHSIGVNSMLDLLSNHGTFLKRPVYNIYLYTGSELTYFHHRLPEETKRQNELTGGFTTSFPVGVGLRFRRSKQGDISFEFLHYFSTSPHIDINLRDFDHSGRNDRWFAFRIRLS